jgi:hypothetical protein
MKTRNIARMHVVGSFPTDELRRDKMKQIGKIEPEDGKIRTTSPVNSVKQIACVSEKSEDENTGKIKEETSPAIQDKDENERNQTLHH